jgi:uncharacterized protein YjbI with pentapeptide repeats
MENLIADRTFNKLSFREQPLEAGEYDHCQFSDCDFSELDLMHFKFIDCTFLTCNFSLAKTNGTSFQQAIFKGCKLLGIRFDLCKPFNLSFTFEGCNLEHSTFYNLKIKKTTFRDCVLRSVDFSGCDLSSSTLLRCDLADATITGCNLEKADFRGSFYYRLDPSANKIKKAKFSLDGLPGLLAQYDIVVE